MRAVPCRNLLSVSWTCILGCSCDQLRTPKAGHIKASWSDVNVNGRKKAINSSSCGPKWPVWDPISGPKSPPDKVHEGPLLRSLPGSEAHKLLSGGLTWGIWGGEVMLQKLMCFFCPLNVGEFDLPGLCLVPCRNKGCGLLARNCSDMVIRSGQKKFECRPPAPSWDNLGCPWSTVRAETIAELILERAGPVIF